MDNDKCLSLCVCQTHLLAEEQLRVDLDKGAWEEATDVSPETGSSTTAPGPPSLESDLSLLFQLTLGLLPWQPPPQGSHFLCQDDLNLVPEVSLCLVLPQPSSTPTAQLLGRLPFLSSAPSKLQPHSIPVLHALLSPDLYLSCFFCLSFLPLF